ncbi:MAG: helix-turn-helix transcriptional regulator [Bacilli bacterium]|nr:helix-turn-helix domain-containing protein [Acholeplasmataceae bacterium]MDY2903206.1 helix-turn-helix transcriptional regulator [Bacilli bacterium]
MIDFVKVGNVIMTKRRQLNMTQDDLANHLFVTRQLVSKWENGTGVPSIDVLIELSKLFKIPVEELLCLNEEFIVNEENIFSGHNRMFVIENIINNNIKVDLPSVFYQFSNTERMIVLRAIKDGRLKIDIKELYPKLTPEEQLYIRKEI